MSLQPVQLIEEAEDCLSLEFIDDTGAYDDPDNLTGYGAPNLATADVTSATILVKKYGYTEGYLFTFTIAANVISAATVTAPNGDVTDILADLTSTAFPFIEDVNPFVIIGEWLGYGEDSEIVSSNYYFEYNVSDGTDTYTASKDQAIICQICCCVENMVADLDARSDCKECSDAVSKAATASMYLDSSIWATERGAIEKSQANLLEAKNLCEGGCGC